MTYNRRTSGSTGSVALTLTDVRCGHLGLVRLAPPVGSRDVNRRQRLVARILHASHRWIERSGAIAPGTALGDEFGTLAPGACIAFPPMSLFGTRSMHIGAGTMIGRACSLGVGYGPYDPSAPERGLVIGERCVIGARATITAHESVTIGDDVWFGQDVYISDANHGY